MRQTTLQLADIDQHIAAFTCRTGHLGSQIGDIIGKIAAIAVAGILDIAATALRRRARQLSSQNMPAREAVVVHSVDKTEPSFRTKIAPISCVTAIF
jgi:hypothetical protein